MVTTLSVTGLNLNANLSAMAAVCYRKQTLFVIKLVVLCKYLFKQVMLLMLLHVGGCLMFDSVFLCTTVKAFVSFCQLSVFDADGRGQAWPRLLHTANSSQLDMWLDGVSPRSNHSRFLLELLAVGGAYTPSHVEIHRSIDDEFTPSMFSVRQTKCAHKLVYEGTRH